VKPLARWNVLLLTVACQSYVRNGAPPLVNCCTPDGGECAELSPAFGLCVDAGCTAQGCGKDSDCPAYAPFCRGTAFRAEANGRPAAYCAPRPRCQTPMDCSDPLFFYCTDAGLCDNLPPCCVDSDCPALLVCHADKFCHAGGGGLNGANACDAG
jgi:hypothetical protein